MRKKRRTSLISENKLRKRRKIKPEININIGKLISEYLIHSYLYYEKQINVISDKEFDEIAYKLLENFDEIEQSEHIHKHLIKKTALEGATGFSLIGKFPLHVQYAALELIK